MTGADILALQLQGFFSNRQCEPLLGVTSRMPAAVEYAADVAHTKRFLERQTADRAFREELARDARAAAARHGLRCDPEEIRALWDPSARDRGSAGNEAAPTRPVVRYQAFRLEQALYREIMRTKWCTPVHPRYRLWRQRQIDRCETELDGELAAHLLHVPFAIELSRGCSVGCWFCGLEAVKRTADFLYTRDNARLWWATLEALRGVVGPEAEAYCYWATEPFDNPDYERFCADVARIFGRFPQTTTALPHKDPERTRALLRSSRELGCKINRLSILTLGIFNRVMEEFSAEELLYTEVIPRNMESLEALADAGSARGNPLFARLAAGSATEEAAETPRARNLGTIACLSGFLLNMVDRSVQLITPCTSSNLWPKGHWILAESRFSSGAELASILKEMIDSRMAETVGPDDCLAFRGDLTHSSTDGGFTLTSRFTGKTFEGGAYMCELGKLVATGQLSATQLARRLQDEHGLAPSWTLEKLNALFQSGVLEEDPARFGIRGAQQLSGAVTCVRQVPQDGS
jgi:radical SAM family RiPP maturation amino acid epimerase